MWRLFVIVLVIFAGACSEDEVPVDCEKEGPSIHLDVIVNATSCSSKNGSIAVSASGGKEPYTYYINNQAAESTGHFQNLAAGSYSVVLTDANNCSTSIDNITILADDFSFSTTIAPNTSCLSGNGSVIVEVEQLDPPYKYRLADGAFTSNNTFTGLTTGTHTIIVEDNSNCSVVLQVSVPKGNTVVSWENDILPIMKKSCAISGCHNGVSRVNDFNKYASAKQYAKDMKKLTQDRTMPFEGSITQREIDLIACWVDDGAIQN